MQKTKIKQKRNSTDAVLCELEWSLFGKNYLKNRLTIQQVVQLKSPYVCGVSAMCSITAPIKIVCFYLKKQGTKVTGRHECCYYLLCFNSGKKTSFTTKIKYLFQILNLLYYLLNNTSK